MVVLVGGGGERQHTLIAIKVCFACALTAEREAR